MWCKIHENVLQDPKKCATRPKKMCCRIILENRCRFFAQIESHCKQLIQHRALFLDSIAKRHLETMLKSVKIHRITLQHCLDIWISTIKNCLKIYVGIHRYRNDSLKPKEVLHVHVPLYQWNCIQGGVDFALG